MKIKLAETGINHHTRAFLLLIILSVSFLFLFYGKLLISLNSFYFSASGDGLKAYYSALYHIEYDESYIHFEGMNYPYGEHIVFTDSQPIISFSIKFISEYIVDISGYTLGIINLMMLSSIVIGAVFLFLIFRKLNVNGYYAALVSTGIAFLSPQIMRFGGHFSLSYVYAIPLAIYGLLLFYEKQSLRNSLFIGIILFVLGNFHLYYFSFIALIILFAWFILIVLKRGYRNWLFVLKNLGIQLVLPFILINCWIWITDDVSDRTSFPWGFLVYTSGWEGIFLKNAHLPWEWFKEKIAYNSVAWEGIAYVGHVGSLMHFIIFGLFSMLPFFHPINLTLFIIAFFTGVLVFLVKRKHLKWYLLTDHLFLNVLLWASLIALLISFAWPFIFEPDLVLYIGPLKQFRGIGRFSWVFFYTINIAAFYFLYHMPIKNRGIKTSLLVIAALILFTDAWTYNTGNRQHFLSQGTLKDNKLNCTLAFEPDNYQAIIPLPYFHVGSENFWLAPEQGIERYVFDFSCRTGLPTTAVLLGRTSLHQSLKSIEMFREPYRMPAIFNDFPNEKPFVLLRMKAYHPTETEQKMLDAASLLCEDTNYVLYSLGFHDLRNLYSRMDFQEIFQQIHKDTLVKQLRKDTLFAVKTVSESGNYEFSKSPANVMYNTYKEANKESGYFTEGVKKGFARKYTVLYEGTPSILKDTSLVLSFWFSGIDRDLFPRSTLEIVYKGKHDSVYRVDYTNIHRQTVITDSSWALIECHIDLSEIHDKLNVTIWNDNIRKDTLMFDNLMLRPADKDVYLLNESYIMKNNRYYSK